ncbi:MAG: hypothetical protein IPP78_04315 [Holophagaceae bacterium]|nr:hypothetical protein [Holophagaceae bacterium]
MRHSVIALLLLLLGCGGSTSSIGPMPGVPPSISVQPQSQSVTAPATAIFSVTATGDAPLAYQWRKNGTDIQNATGASYTTPATTVGDSGSQFTVRVSNAAGNVVCNVATLTVAPPGIPPSISAQPQSQSITAPATATFSVTATGDAPLVYQWRKNGTDIQNATGASYTTPATTVGDSGSQFTVRVSNAAGNVASSVATLIVAAPPVPDFSLAAASGTVTSGTSGPATINITRTNGHTAAITLGIQANSQNITGSGTVGTSSSSGILTIAVPGGAPAGPLSLTFTGNDGTFVHTAALNLTVVALTKVRFFSASWGDNAIRITDDLLNVPGVATPRLIQGANTQISNMHVDHLAVDRTRKMIYVVNTNPAKILVWHNADTVSGNVAPNRVITLQGVTSFEGVTLDSAHDRLYVAGYAGSAVVCAINSASTLNGNVTPTALLDAPGVWLCLDPVNDRLYTTEGAADKVYRFDNASTLATGATPSRAISFTGLSLRKIWVDPASDRMYLASRNTSAGGFNIFAFNAAASLTGAIADPDTASAARHSLGTAMNVMVDAADRLYFWEDSATNVRIFFNASALSGTITRQPDKAIPGVVQHGYGMDYLLY